MEFKNNKFLILGLSITGKGVAKFLHNKGALVYLSEFDKSKENSKEHKEIKKYCNFIEFGGHSEKFIEGANCVILSPSIPQSAPVLKLLNEKNVKYFSDIEFAYKILGGGDKFVTITGTNGKTTTTMLTSHILSAKFKAPACGNIGISPLEILAKDENTDFLVCETSSYQAHYSPTFAPKIGIFCNLTPDHTSFHGNLENYFEAKAKIFKNQDKGDYAILNKDDERVKELGKKLRSTVYYFSTKSDADCCIKNSSLYFKEEKIIDIKDVQLVGEHNYQNILCAICAAKILNIPNEIIKNQIKDFKTPEHRCEFVCEENNIKFYNDSKATNPEATIVALSAFKGQDVCLIAGGRDKNTNLKEFCDAVKNNIKWTVLIGEARERFEHELRKSGYENIIFANSLEDAVEKSLEKNPNIVLLSPACASFDMFKSFEDRGEKFKKYVLSKKTTDK